MKLHHVAAVCSSQDNADRFYEGILGLKKIKTFSLNKDLAEQIFDTARECQIILYGNEDFAIEVFIVSEKAEKATLFEHLCLEVEDKEELLLRCKSKGLAVKRIPKGDSLLTFIGDYDGNLFEIKESVA